MRRRRWVIAMLASVVALASCSIPPPGGEDQDELCDLASPDPGVLIALYEDDGTVTYQCRTRHDVVDYEPTPYLQPDTIVSAGGYLWVAEGNGADECCSTLARVGADGQVLDTTSLAPSHGRPHDIVFDGTHLWIALWSGLLVKVDLAGTVVASYPTERQLGSLGFDGTFLWLGHFGSNQVDKFDPDTGAVVASHLSPDPWSIEFDGANLWIAGPNGPDPFSVAKLRPADGATLGTVHLPKRVHRLMYAGGALWATANGALSETTDTTLYRIDAGTVAVTGHVDLWSSVIGRVLAADSTHVWVQGAPGGYPGIMVTRIDMSDLSVDDSYRVLNQVMAVEWDGALTWVLSTTGMVRLET